MRRGGSTACPSSERMEGEALRWLRSYYSTEERFCQENGAARIAQLLQKCYLTLNIFEEKTVGVIGWRLKKVDNTCRLHPT